MKSDRRMGPSVSENGLSGPNEDNPGLFSLEALAAKAVSATQAAPTVDDSGLIDLKKLMASAEAAESLPPVLSPLEAYPFGAPEMTPLPQTFEATKPAEAVDGGKKAKWLLMSFVVVTSAIVTVVVLQMQSARNAPASESIRMGQAPAAVEIPKTEPVRPIELVPLPVNRPKENTAAAANNAVSPRARGPATNTPKRERAQQKAPVTKSKTQAEPPPPPAEPCDLRCEIDRRMKKKE